MASSLVNEGSGSPSGLLLRVACCSPWWGGEKSNNELICAVLSSYSQIWLQTKHFCCKRFNCYVLWRWAETCGVLNVGNGRGLLQVPFGGGSTVKYSLLCWVHSCTPPRILVGVTSCLQILPLGGAKRQGLLGKSLVVYSLAVVSRESPFRQDMAVGKKRASLVSEMVTYKLSMF